MRVPAETARGLRERLKSSSIAVSRSECGRTARVTHSMVGVYRGRQQKSNECLLCCVFRIFIDRGLSLDSRQNAKRGGAKQPCLRRRRRCTPRPRGSHTVEPAMATCARRASRPYAPARFIRQCSAVGRVRRRVLAPGARDAQDARRSLGTLLLGRATPTLAALFTDTAVELGALLPLG